MPLLIVGCPWQTFSLRPLSISLGSARISQRSSLRREKNTNHPKPANGRAPGGAADVVVTAVLIGARAGGGGPNALDWDSPDDRSIRPP